ncbi:MAG: hypothetical protein KGQ60_00065 [Planctomycetes bacterium]|nr:hypothetical protein [Planctomycetota bacterium]
MSSRKCRPRAWKRLCGCLLVCVCLFGYTGCSRSQPDDLISTADSVPIDSLAPEEKVKRFILDRVLLAFLNGARELQDLQLEAGSVHLREGIEDFYGRKNRLISYSFVGAPARGAQTVKLVFDDQASGPADASSRVEETRTYRVVDTGSGTSIERVR